ASRDDRWPGARPTGHPDRRSRSTTSQGAVLRHRRPVPHLRRNTSSVMQHRALRSVLVSAVLALTATAVFAESGSPTPSIGEPAQDRTGGAVPEFGVMVGPNEMVMPPYTQITATTTVGTIVITAGEDLKRCFTWDGITGCVKL